MKMQEEIAKQRPILKSVELNELSILTEILFFR